ncbi:MAG: ANTAR domain-containing protein, partial [Streptomyces sp.]|nr:ANTAR domain-containing protein [Streptomyces sp.]
MDRLRDQAATSTVVERAKGAVMALTGCSPDAAGEELVKRAKMAHRTLLEECWLTLGDLVPPLSSGTSGPDLHAALPETTLVRHDTTDLGRLGKALVRVGTPQDLARCLLEHLSPGAEADAVMIYARLPAGGLALIGHAGIDETLAAQWR